MRGEYAGRVDASIAPDVRWLAYMAFDDIVSQVSGGLPGLASGEPVFKLRVADAELRVVRFAGHEAISEPFEFRVEVAGGELDPEALVGQPALL
ncbi:MAG TPA: hypothetical protein VGB85_12900, partial [Nannocystis sp.]